MKGRYFLFQCSTVDNVFQVPGKRTTGTKAQKFAITGPGWVRNAAGGCHRIQVPDRHGLDPRSHLQHRHGTGLQEVHALQDQVSVVPLSSYGKPFKAEAGTVDAALDMKTAVREQVNAMDGAAYFRLFAELLKTNPPTAEDAPMVAKLAKIGIVPGQDFDATKARARRCQGDRRRAQPSQDLIMGWMKAGIAAGEHEAGERLALHNKDPACTAPPTLQRALVTAIGLGANRPQDAVYPTSEGPDVLKKYSGEKKYVMRFDKGQLPPVERLLVADDVRQRLLFRRQSAQPVQREPAQTS